MKKGILPLALFSSIAFMMSCNNEAKETKSDPKADSIQYYETHKNEMHPALSIVTKESGPEIIKKALVGVWRHDTIIVNPEDKEAYEKDREQYFKKIDKSNSKIIRDTLTFNSSDRYSEVSIKVPRKNDKGVSESKISRVGPYEILDNGTLLLDADKNVKRTGEKLNIFSISPDFLIFTDTLDLMDQTKIIVQHRYKKVDE